VLSPEARSSNGGRPSLASHLVFAGCATLGTLVWVTTTASLFGYGGASAFCALGWVVFHPLFVAPSVERGAAGAALAFVLATPVAWLMPPPLVALALTPLLLGIVRSALLYAQPFARALLVESGLGLASLLAIVFFYDGGLLGTVLAAWAFWLVQSAFALIPRESRPPDDRPVDPFDRAHAAALTILDRRR